METTLLNNRYRLLQTLGRGGFGETFLAVDTHMPSERKCAIKQLQPAIKSPQAWVRERFQREAVILEELGENHEQIPRLYAYFAEGGDFYLVQEWIPGQNLKQLQEKQGPLSPAAVEELLIKLLPVLDYVHNRKIVHRDVKPENIILRAGDRLPILIDFGAVKEALVTGINEKGSTSLGIGTPGYMAPEQAAGRPVYSSDLYSLGLTAIYLLTGKSPQQLKTDSETGEILWRQELPQFHSNLATVIDRTVRFHPRDRFSNAQEMLKALTKNKSVSTGATQVVAPVYKSSTTEEQPTSATMVVSHPPLEKEGGPLRLILPMLLGGGVALAAFVMGFSLFFPLTTRQVTVTTPTPDSSEPRSFPPITEPEPEVSISPEVEETPAEDPQLEVSPSPDEEEVPEIVIEPSPEASPEITPAPVIKNIPTFALGTSQEQIRNTLGEPTSIYAGSYQTQVWIYDNFQSQQVRLSYVFNTETSKLLQTDITFQSSVELQVMRDTLDRLCGGQAATYVQEALTAVYQGDTLRSFRLEKANGMIRRITGAEIRITLTSS